MLDTWFESKLTDRKKNSSLRALTTTDLIDFTSNDYLGLARSKELYDRITAALKSEHIEKNGATGSRLLSGNSCYTQDVEERLAKIFKSESALIFNSGYAANLGVLSSIPQRGDTILYDELAHACIKDGARLSLAQRFSFRHNNPEDLEQKLKRAHGKIFIAVESIYSMDGDQCPLQRVVELAENYQASVILDEAHSTGAVGENGSGLAVSLGLEEKIAVRVYTFGKAMGIHGACVAGSSFLTQYLINFSRPFIYTTALSPHAIASIDCAFKFLSENISIQQILTQKIELFRSATKEMANQTDSNSAIQTAVFPGNEQVKRMANALQQNGFDVRPILSPTVPEGSERLRICLHTYNHDNDILKLCEGLVKLSQE